jgi:hypothetical protein
VFSTVTGRRRNPVTCSTRSGVTCHPFCPCRRHGLPVYGDNLDLTVEREPTGSSSAAGALRPPEAVECGLLQLRGSCAVSGGADGCGLGAGQVGVGVSVNSSTTETALLSRLKASYVILWVVPLALLTEVSADEEE